MLRKTTFCYRGCVEALQEFLVLSKTVQNLAMSGNIRYNKNMKSIIGGNGVGLSHLRSNANCVFTGVENPKLQTPSLWESFSQKQVVVFLL